MLNVYSSNGICYDQDNLNLDICYSASLWMGPKDPEFILNPKRKAILVRHK